MFSRTPTISIALTVFAVCLLIMQMLFLSEQFDAYTLLQEHDIKTWQIPFAYSGHAAKLLLLVAAIYFLIRRSDVIALIGKYSRLVYPQHFARIIGLQLASFITLLFFTGKIFSPAEFNDPAGPTAYAIWMVSAVAVLMLWLYALLPWHRLVKYIRREKNTLASSLGLGLLILMIAMAGQKLWDPLANTTFLVSQFILGLYSTQTLYSIPEARELGLGDFVVSISPACSGYEGIGLIVCFTAIYLFANRNRFKFPQAFLLFPIGASLIWLLNCIRIAVLIIIGDRWSPDVAIGGFHSHAGWIAFIMVSLFILFVAGHIGWWLKVAAHETCAPETYGPKDTALSEKERITSAPLDTLFPFVALMAMTLLTSAASSDFDYLYPLRVIVVAAVFAAGFKHLDLLPFKPRIETIGAALIVTALWLLMVGTDHKTSAAFAQNLQTMSPGVSITWLLFRAIGAVITVPIAEELAFRGYLLSRLSRSESFIRGKIAFSLIPVAVTSIAFGLLHSTWLAGIMAGLIFALVRIRSSHIGDAIVCHALANLLIFIYAVFTGNWSLL
ncbi:MAG: exosortase E/protease, VPEID-CTERM system [Spongiibacteraceae bacterium]